MASPPSPVQHFSPIPRKISIKFWAIAQQLEIRLPRKVYFSTCKSVFNFST